MTVLAFVLAAGLYFPAAPAGAAPPAFDEWLAALRVEARSRGISAATLDAALAGVAPIPRVVELDRRQPEFTLTFEQYMSRVVSARRVAKGRERLARHGKLLSEISAKYGVPARYLVALWGIETDFGRLRGGFSVVASLATLAYDGRRSAYFRRELFNALRILEDGHISPARMIGSWAGAMGQPQFMPSTFVGFAVDHDGDGRFDIWDSRADVFASAANYLAKSGWRSDQIWGRRVRLPPGIDPALANLAKRKKLAEWAALGLRRAGGGALPKVDINAALVMPAGADGPAFLVYENFRVILKWNRSTLFGLAVGRLADRIGGG